VNSLNALLTARAADPSGRLYVEGAWIERTTTVPIDGGIKMVVEFAERCWRRNLTLQQSAVEARRKLAQAEVALMELTERGLNKEVAIALAAVEAALEFLG
jgi:hypothetical protein